MACPRMVEPTGFAGCYVVVFVGMDCCLGSKRHESSRYIPEMKSTCTREKSAALRRQIRRCVHSVGDELYHCLNEDRRPSSG